MRQITYTPANGASLGSYLFKNWLFCRKGKNRLTKIAQAAKLANLTWNEFLCVSVYGELNNYWRFTDRQTDGQTDKFSDTIYRGGSRFFLSVKFATSLLALLAGENSLEFNGISNIYCDRKKKHRMLNRVVLASA